MRPHKANRISCANCSVWFPKHKAYLTDKLLFCSQVCASDFLHEEAQSRTQNQAYLNVQQPFRGI
jgi:hypothetical protein